ncbi:MAG: hypothetical protein M3Y27_24410 [Acidobacteriota bacterium]|nr:hypothetical protein [Acidobacteriota bacterium]
MLHVDNEHRALTQIGDGFEQFDRLLFEQEVLAGEFRARSVLTADLHLLDDFGSRIKDGLAIPDDKILDAPEVKPLHQFHKAAMRIGKG